jgi:large subunit ribosomal protein L17
MLFAEIAPAQKDRNGGYTRIVKMHQRQGDASQLAILEWVDLGAVAETPVAEKPAEETKPEAAKEEKAAKKGKKKKEEAAEAKA